MGYFFRTSTKRAAKERDYAELAEHFDSPSAIVKAKINALRAQLGRQMAKNRKQKVIRQQTKIILSNIMETLTQTNPTCWPNI